MNNAKINNEIELTYPDGFNQMSDEELARYFGTAENRWGVYNPEDHIVLSVGWKKLGFFSSMSDAETALIGIEGRLCRTLLNYQKVGSFKIKIGKKKAEAIRFEYRVVDAALVQVCDLIVFKHKKKLYTVYYVTRKTNAASARAALQEVIKSMSLS